MCASLRVVTKRELESVEICNSTKAAYGTQKLAVTDTGQSPAGLFIARGLPQAHGSYCLSCSSVNRSVAQCRRQTPHLAFALRDLTQTVLLHATISVGEIAQHNKPITGDFSQSHDGISNMLKANIIHSSTRAYFNASSASEFMQIQQIIPTLHFVYKKPNSLLSKRLVIHGCKLEMVVKTVNCYQ